MPFAPVLSKSLSTGNIKTPGYMTGGSSHEATNTRFIQTGAQLYPGLFAGRAGVENNTQITSLDTITTPTVDEVKGVVVKTTTIGPTGPGLNPNGLPFSYDNLSAFFLPIGLDITVVSWSYNSIYVLVGADVRANNSVHIATTTTSGGSPIYAGSIVAAATPGSLDISSIAAFSIADSVVDLKRGDIVPICLAQLSP